MSQQQSSHTNNQKKNPYCASAAAIAYWQTGRLFVDDDALIPPGVLQDLCFCAHCSACVAYEYWRAGDDVRHTDMRVFERGAAFSARTQPPLEALRYYQCERIVHAPSCIVVQAQHTPVLLGAQ